MNKHIVKSVLKGRFVFTFLSFVMIVCLGLPSMAQERVSVQFRPSVSFAIQSLGDADLKTGLSFEGMVAYRFMPHLSGYAGWGWNKFSSPKSFAGDNIDFEETGYVLGLQFIHPFGEHSATQFFLKGGAILNHIEAENNEGKIIADTGHGTGFQAEAGVSLPLGDRLNLLPGIKYQSLSRNFHLGEERYPVDLNYLSAGATLSWTF